MNQYLFSKLLSNDNFFFRIAFESLKTDLDPEDENVLVSSEKFYEVMNKWAKKIANSNDEDDEFNRTPRLVTISILI